MAAFIRLYYIFILHQTTTANAEVITIGSLYYIFILHQTTTPEWVQIICKELYYIFILHQTTTRKTDRQRSPRVVLYLHSTSNHNSYHTHNEHYYVVLYLHSTSNHNYFLELFFPMLLYYIFILHQTTTRVNTHEYSMCCIISSFYIKPQRRTRKLSPSSSCIISSFYIKPQHIPLTLLIFSRLKTILGDMKLFDETYLIQSY